MTHQGRILGSITGPTNIITVTEPTMREYLYVSPDNLPTSSPTNPQISYTLQASDFPTISGINQEAVKFSAIVYGAVRTATVYADLIKNSVSQLTSSGTLTGLQYCTINGAVFPDVKIGDILACKLWGSSSALTLNWRGLYLYPTNIDLGPKEKAIIDLKIGTSTAYPAFALGNPSASEIANLTIYNGNKTMAGGESSIIVPITRQNDTYNLFRVAYGDYNSTINFTASGTYYPYYKRNRTVSTIEYTTTNIIV